MQNNCFLSPLNIHDSWNNFLDKDILFLLQDIESKVNMKENITPRNNLVLRFLEMDITRVQVIILGQDPYPQEGVATGRAFEVSGLNSWKDKFRNASLKNMLRAIYKAYEGKSLKYSEIICRINEGDRLAMPDDFKILPPSQLFKYWWDEQNVLLLNTAFTCEVGKPNSHTKVWASFTRALLEFIADANPNIIWFLWGNNAQKAVEGIPIPNKIETTHPMICFERDDDILFGKINPFEETKDKVDWTGNSRDIS